MYVDIDKRVEKFECPDPSFWCTVSTTVYNEEERRKICHNCWLSYCKKNNIQIIIGKDANQ